MKTPNLYSKDDKSTMKEVDAVRDAALETCKTEDGKHVIHELRNAQVALLTAIRKADVFNEQRKKSRAQKPIFIEPSENHPNATNPIADISSDMEAIRGFLADSELQDRVYELADQIGDL